MAPFSYSDPNVLAFVVIPVLLVLALALGMAVASWRVGERASATQRALTVIIVGGVWMFAWWMVASTGVLRLWDAAPPPFAAVVIGVVAMSLLIAYSGYGKRLAAGIPLWILVVIQGFRLPLELAMHSLYENGVMPQQMSYSGQNFDIITGVTALMIAPILRTGRGRGLAVAWNALGFALLVNIVVVAILSTPRLQYFGPEPERLNVFITYPPFVWLPTVMVVAALAGHLLIVRALWTNPSR